MTQDPRKGNSFFYDLDETPLPDVPFYLREISSEASVLELGCGTGRVLLPLAKHVREIFGIDYSNDMIECCRGKLRGFGNVSLAVGDITSLNLGRRFDVVIAPYRVFQALETDNEVEGFFDSIRRHLARGGFAIINTFKMKANREEMIRNWARPGEMIRWEKHLSDAIRVVHSELYERIQSVPLVIFPELIYRKFNGTLILQEFVQKIKMRCYEPDELLGWIKKSGFESFQCWGGYQGEKFGEGPELVVKFR